MKKSIIFCFTGTGNSLTAANDIAKHIENAKVVSMRKENENILEGDYEYIGFVFPVYFVGLPKRVSEFVKKLNTEKVKSEYIFSLATKGEMEGNATAILSKLLKEKNITLNYGKSINMFSNYVVLYDMSENTEKIEAKYEKEIKYIIDDIVLKKTIKLKKENLIFNLWYNSFIKNVNEKDKNFNVSDDCISCEICKKVCPVKNIEMKNSKPEYKHRCEQCMACIHFCPKKAINYKNKTQNRRRYHNKNFSFKDIEKFNNT